MSHEVRLYKLADLRLFVQSAVEFLISHFQSWRLLLRNFQFVWPDRFDLISAGLFPEMLFDNLVPAFASVHAILFLKPKLLPTIVFQLRELNKNPECLYY